MPAKDERNTVDEFAGNGEFVWERIAQVLSDLNLPVKNDQARTVPPEKPSRHFIVEGSRRHRLDFHIELVREESNSRLECKLHLIVDDLRAFQGVREKFSITRQGAHPIEAIESCLERTEELLAKLFTRSDFTQTEMTQLAKSLQLPREWETHVTYDGWQFLLDIVHAEQKEVIARVRFSNRQIIFSILDLLFDPQRLEFKDPLEIENTSGTPSKLSESTRLALYKDHVVGFLFRDAVTDLLQSQEALERWGKRVFDLLKHSRGQFGLIRGLFVSESAFPAPMSRTHVENVVSGYRTGELWEEYICQNVEEFLYGPDETDY